VDAVQFYKLEPGSVVVFHDEVDLSTAKVRVKIGGGVAGHNGLRSITANIGNDYKRVRIGIGKPDIKELVPMHVLGDFAKTEWVWVEALCDVIADNAALLVEGKDSSFQNKVHLAMAAKGFDQDEEPPGSE
jgi:PTH1 family peptidyl-tRNA hydrolase